ncbi:MAG TPA: TonB-dependent receptor [Sphingomicrobium sp.]|nr:TonB-dependent receptor [Sphingomicrobium sp.]
MLSSASIATAQTAPEEPETGADAPAQAEGEAIVVTGIRRSITDSIRTKREADSIVDVVTAEDVGKFPDNNVAESLSRIPGITVDHQFGEGEQLSINGVEPALNRLTIDGHSVASADWGGNPSDRSSRTFNYSLLSPAIISQAIVYKTPEARLQEGAIGGSVDIITRKPLDLKPHTLTANVGGEYNDRVKKGSFRGSALYSWRNESETLGLLAAVNYDKEQLSRAGVAVYWYRPGSELMNAWTLDANGNAVSGATLNGHLPTAAELAEFSTARHAAFLAHEFFRQQRKRIGFQGAIQSRPVENLTLTATALVIRGNYDNVSNSEYTYGYDGSQMTAAEFSDGVVTSATFRPVAAGSTGATGQLDTLYRRTRVKNDTYSLLYDWQPGDWNVTGNVGYTKASGGKDPEYLLDFRTQQGFTSGTFGKTSFVDWENPATDASQWLSNFTALGGENINEPAVLAANGGQPFFGRQIGGITKSDFTLDKEKFGQFDVSRKVEFGPITEILFGARYSDHDNSNETVGGATFTNEDFTLADLDPLTRDASLYDGLGTSGNSIPFAALGRQGIIDTLERFGTINISRGFSKGSFFHVNEKILNGYVQANFKAGRFRGNVGGRFVQTKDTSNFYVNSGGTEELTRVSNTDRRFLPAVNVIYDAGEDVVLRASAAKVIARARYSDLAGYTSLDDTTRTGGGGNPDLKPYAATNYGLSAEWYFAPGSYLSGEVFHRNISNYIGNEVQDGVEITNPVTGNTLEYSISRPVNGGKAKVTGFSLSGNANLLWGFGIQGNYTFADAETGLDTGLPFLSRSTFTIVPYFEKGPIQARISYNRRSKYFYRHGRMQSRDYADAYRQLDAQISYAINKNIQVTANASNLLDETYYQYSSDPRFPTSVYKNGRVYSLSATFRM